jgi:Zn-dependent M28 family amino/carboxypeptidase
VLLRSLGRWLTPRPRGPIAPPAPLETVLMGDDSPAALARLLCGRDNPSREAALPRYLQHRGIAFTRHRFTRPEGRGDTFAVELGEGPRVLVLCAHHDAIPGSPGANDNAAAVGILLHLIPRLPPRIPRGWRVRLLFTAAEELDYLGARAYVEDTRLDDVAGVLSLELCGIGDTVALWDAGTTTPFLDGITASLESAGLGRETGHRVVGRIPVFGSDHRAFAAAGLPAYGFTMVPAAHAEALRRFVLSPLRGSVRHLIRRPPPFHTYHTSADALETLEPAALHRAAAALTAIVGGLR